MLVFGRQRLGSDGVVLRAMDFVFDRQKGVLQAAFDQGDGEVRNVTRSSTAPEGRARSDCDTQEFPVSADNRR